MCVHCYQVVHKKSLFAPLIHLDSFNSGEHWGVAVCRSKDLAGLDVIWQSEIRDIIAQKSAWRRKNWSEAP